MTLSTIQQIPLLTFAHRNEAMFFLTNESCQNIDNPFNLAFFKNEKYFLLITGEGDYPTFFSLSFVLATFHSQINKIYNLGAAGSLDLQVKINEIHSIRTVYQQRWQKKLEFKSFSSSDPEAKIDCVSAAKRINSNEDKEVIEQFAAIVDRELWSIAYLAKLYKIPWIAFKYISDLANNENICEDVTSLANQISSSLYNYFLNCQKDFNTTTEEKIETPPGHFTESMWREYLKLSKSIKIKCNDFNLETLFKKHAEIKDKKQMAQAILVDMRELLNPFNSQFNKELISLCSEFISSGCQLKIPKDIEREQTTLSIPLNLLTNKKTLLRNIEQFDVEKMNKIFDGQLDV